MHFHALSGSFMLFYALSLDHKKHLHRIHHDRNCNDVKNMIWMKDYLNIIIITKKKFSMEIICLKKTFAYDYANF